MLKKALVLGGTGAMGVYLVPKLARRGYMVDVISLDSVSSDNEQIRYIQANAADDKVLYDLLENHYDVIVDFLVYPDILKFHTRHNLFLNNTAQYIFLSTYRIYASEYPIIENSPRLADVNLDPAYITSGDYSYYKAREEDILRNSERKNWTIIRPAVTFSKRRFQLVTLEAEVLIWRMMRGKTVLLPEEALDMEATMSWAGDVAEMITRLIGNPKALGEAFTVSTSEHHTWQQIAEFYKEIGGLNYHPVPLETYLSMITDNDDIHVRQQLLLDRCFHRVIDNSKILAYTGMHQSELISVFEGLKREFNNLNPDSINGNVAVNTRMDNWLENNKL